MLGIQPRGDRMPRVSSTGSLPGLLGQRHTGTSSIECLEQRLGPGRGSPGSCGGRNTPSSEVLLMRFSDCMVPEVYQLFWAAMARGEFITDAAVEAGTYRKQGTRWLMA
jgi:hypothetical protein